MLSGEYGDGIAQRSEEIVRLRGFGRARGSDQRTRLRA